jgi:hypothetical protein
MSLARGDFRADAPGLIRVPSGTGSRVRSAGSPQKLPDRKLVSDSDSSQLLASREFIHATVIAATS